MNTSEIIVQGSFLNLFEIGTLITGKEGIGKSELALSLTSRHHQFIADDAPLFSIQGGKIIGKNPLEAQDAHFILVRGIGLIDIRLLFGPTSVSHQHTLDLIIHLEEEEISDSNDHLIGATATKDILGCLIPCVTIPIIKPRNLDVLVETIVKNYLLKNNKEIIPVNNFNELLIQKMDTSHS